MTTTRDNSRSPELGALKKADYAISVSFDDLETDDRVVIHDYGHNAHGASGKVYWLDAETKMVSVVTDGCVDVWEGYADGLQKVVE